MYYSLGCFMVCSSLPRPLLAKNMLAKPELSRSFVDMQSGSHLRGFFVLACIIGALALAPEQPDQQASICQNHNSIAACLVW